jgi:hypothetical protein
MCTVCTADPTGFRSQTCLEYYYRVVEWMHDDKDCDASFSKKKQRRELDNSTNDIT